jgi:N6-adenosine-specific RNA methylase IME4
MEGKKYQLVYADPPWEYKVWSRKGRGRSAESHYDTMGLDQLKLLPVPVMCAKDCVLLLWATGPGLAVALELGGAWGFVYKTVAFVWVKKNRNNDRFFTGLGYYTRANAEWVLLFTKGRPLPRMRKDLGQIVVAKVGRHSQKPAEIRTKIVELFGDRPRVELFARSREGFFPNDEYQGWDVFGNEVEGSIELSADLNKNIDHGDEDRERDEGFE